MTDDEQLGGRTHAKHEEALFFGRVLIIEELHREFVVENGLGVIEGNTMLPQICSGFMRIPFELEHKYIVFTTNGMSSRANLMLSNAHVWGAEVMAIFIAVNGVWRVG